MKEIVEPLLNWYQINERPLPWRVDKNPYHIWVSEIMLQQTRIEAVKEYYYRFMKRLPTIKDLAKIKEDELLKLWQGLGYYNRARNLQKAAKMIVEKYSGKFPDNYKDLKALPGIGEYTAGAIASICYNEKVTAIDGNVLRVMMRLQNCHDKIDEKETKIKVEKQLKSILPNQSGKFNQALMELGETICTPTSTPKCQECPLNPLCKSKEKNTYMELPKKNPKQPKTVENYTIFIYIYDNQVAIEKRNNTGLLKNMWEFPNENEKYTQETCQNYLKSKKFETTYITPSIEYKHIFTHKIWYINTYIIYVKNKYPQFKWVTISEIEEKYALPTAFYPCFVEIKKHLTK